MSSLVFESRISAFNSRVFLFFPQDKASANSLALVIYLIKSMMSVGTLLELYYCHIKNHRLDIFLNSSKHLSSRSNTITVNFEVLFKGFHCCSSILHFRDKCDSVSDVTEAPIELNHPNQLTLPYFSPALD